jgi:hypothetical protein
MKKKPLLKIMTKINPYFIRLFCVFTLILFYNKIYYKLLVKSFH